MDSQEESQYTVEITHTSKVFFYEVIEYVFRHHQPDRAEEIARELKQPAESLSQNPNRGITERRMENRPQHYQFILYQRTKRADIKIIYYVDEDRKKVYITDFFPTEMDDQLIAGRS